MIWYDIGWGVIFRRGEGDGYQVRFLTARCRAFRVYRF